jgi:hypothetical protein
VKTAVQALIAEISPCILANKLDQKYYAEWKSLRWITSSEVGSFANNFIGCIIYDDCSE